MQLKKFLKYLLNREWNTGVSCQSQEHSFYLLLILDMSTAGIAYGDPTHDAGTRGRGLTEKTTSELKDPLDMQQHLP